MDANTHVLPPMYELTEEDWKHGVRNPYIDKLCNKIELWVSKKDFATFQEVADRNEERIERVMRRCLATSAEGLRHFDD